MFKHDQREHKAVSTRPKRPPLLAAWVALWIAACLPALAQDNASVRATARELGITCNVDAEHQTVRATLTNRNDHRVTLVVSSAPMDYSVDLTTKNGARLPLTESGENTQLSDAELAKRKGIHPVGGSSQFVELGPNEDQIETVYLKTLYQIPEHGGTFKLHVGRRLPDGFEPNETLWCPVVSIALPPSK